MTAHDKISVIIPTYNRKKFIVKAIESVCQQTLPPHEILVIDDGSTDDTGATLQQGEYADLLQYHKIDHSGKPAIARNYGLRLATGNWVAFLDSDDLWEPRKLERQIELYAGLNEEDQISCGLIDTFNLVIDAATGNVLSRLTFVKQGRSIDRVLAGNYINKTSSVMIRRKVFDEVGVFDENLMIGEDSEMWLRIAKTFSVFTVKEFLTQVRVNTSSISRNIDWQLANHFVFERIIEERHSDLGGELIRRIISFRRALLLQRIYSKWTRDIYLVYFRRFFSEDKTIVLRSRRIVPYLLASLLNRVLPPRLKERT